MKLLKSWLERLWPRDRRRFERLQNPRLIAHYWTGAAPSGQTVRDIGSTGMFLQTDDRWYPATELKITLQRTDCIDGGAEDLFILRARVVRMDADGVGFAFVLPWTQDGAPKQDRLDTVAIRKSLDLFLKRLQQSDLEAGRDVERNRS